MTDPRASTGPHLAFLLGTAKDALLAEMHRRLAEHGHDDVRPSHGYVFRFIPQEGARVTELAEQARVTKQTLGEIATDLERLDYLERVPDPTDRRAKLLRLTDRGRRAQAVARAIFDDVEAGWAERFGEERIALLRETLEEIVAAERGEARTG